METRHEGRFCSACAKTVVDFTIMTDVEVKDFFLDKKEKKVCGRFTGTQLNSLTINLPENIFMIPMPYWKKFLTASLIIFSTTLFSCNTNYDHTVGMILPADMQTINDTLPAKNVLNTIVGKLKMPDTTPVKKSCRPTMGIISQPVRELMGDVEFEPQKVDTAILMAGTVVMVNPKYVKGEMKVIPQKTEIPKINADTIIDKPAVDSCENKSYQ